MNDIQERIVRIIEEKMKYVHSDKVDQSSRLDDLGINSIIFIQIAVAIEQELSIEFDHDHLDKGKYETVKDICDYVASL